MSDSLRDQLLLAGFKEKQARKAPKKAHKKNSPGKKKPKTTTTQANQNNQQSKAAATEQEEIARKKAVKEKIRALIEEHRIKEHAGEEIYSYQVGSRVRQLFVKADYRTGLADGKLVITRLNGNTYLIPPDIAKQVLELNPEWAIIHNQTQASSEDPDYARLPDTR